MVNNKETKLSDILTGKSEKNDTINKNDGKVKKGIQYEGRTPKQIKYADQRKTVLDKIIEILELNKYNNYTFFISDLEGDVEKTKQIQDLVGDIKKYFSYGRWMFFSKDQSSCPYTSLVKSIFKDMGIKFNSVSIRDNVANKIEKQGFKILLNN